MAIPFPKTSFVAGELTPSVWGRVDLSKFHIGASTMRNFFVSYRGGAISRPGTAFIGQCKQMYPAAPPRDIKFQFNINQGYVLEFGDQYMRVKSDGAYVTEPPVSITGITNSDPCTITASTLALQNGNLTNGDWVFLSGIVGTVQLNLKTFIVRNVNLIANTFTLTDCFGNLIDSTAFGVYISGGTLARIFTLVTPYAAVDLPFLKYTQSNDVMTLCLQNQNTGTEYPPYDLSRITASEWTLVDSTFASSIGPPATCTGVTANAGSVNFQYVVTAIDSVTGDESVASGIANVLNAVDPAVNQNTITITWSAVPGAISYNVYRADPSLDTVPVGALFGFIGSAVGVQFQDSNITADFTQVPPVHQDPFAPSPIVAVNVTAQGSGYSQASVGATINTATGSGAVVQPIVVSGAVVAVIVENGGANYAPADTIAITGGTGVPATGSIGWSANVTDGQNVVINGVTWTFKTAVSGANQSQIGASLAATLVGLAGGLSASTSASLTVANYTSNATQLLIAYGTNGTGGNSFTIAGGTSGGVASGGTLSGGSGTGGDATATLSLGPATGTFPGGAAYFQERRYYFNTENQPDTYFGSQPGSFLDMDFSIPITDSDAIVGTPWAQQINGIQSMVPMQSGLVILTGNGAWQLTGGAVQTAVTPSDQDATPQAYNGCSPIVPPITINFDILYVQSKGSIVRDLSFNFFVNIFTGADKTELSSHLFLNYTILQWAWAEEPYKVVWAVRNDGKCLSLTYLKEEDIYGWARHDTNGLYVSVCSVTEPPVDAVYYIVQRYIKGANDGMGAWVYYAERANNRLWVYGQDQWCVDAGSTYVPNYPNAILTPAAADGTMNISSATIVTGGANYTAPVAIVVDPIGDGNGASVTLTVSGGVIDSATVGAQGSGYSSATVIQIVDSTGSGAIIQPNITNVIAFNASAPVFTGQPGFGAVGDTIRCGGGEATVTGNPNSTQVLANVTTPITATLPGDPNQTPVPQASGLWSIVNPITTVTNLDYLDGMTVSILADGIVIEPQVVVAGSIALPQPASTITIGLPFIAQLQTLYFDEPGMSPTVQGRRKQIPALTVRTVNANNIFVGVNEPDASTQPGLVDVPWTDLTQLPGTFPAPGQPGAAAMMTGDSYVHPLTDLSTNGQVALQITDPVGAEIVMLVPEVVVGDTPSP